MDDISKEAAAPDFGMISKILWFAMLSSVLIYVVVGVLAPQKAAAVEPLLIWALTFAGIASYGLSIFIPKLIAKPKHQQVSGAAPIANSPEVSPERQKKLFTAFIVKLVLRESIAIFGLVLLFMGADPIAAYTLIAFSFVALAMAYPKGDTMGIQSD